jgi:hypothetical protein
MKQIAARLGVSVASVHLWTRDISVSEEHRRRNLRAARTRFGTNWSAKSRQRRLAHQAAGRARARRGDPLHQAGCMLYWAEGSKSRNQLVFANSDRAMVAFFCRFLRQSLGVARDEITVRLNVYTSNGLTLGEIEDRWLRALELPRTSLRTHSLNHHPTSSSGQQRNKLPYGVCTIRVRRSTALVQQIYGAIQEGSELGPSRPAARAAPSGRGGGSRPDPRPPNARRRAAPR